MKSTHNPDESEFLTAFFTFFATFHFAEAATYLTINSRFAASDMVLILSYDKRLRFPLLALGFVAVYPIVTLLFHQPFEMRICTIRAIAVLSLLMGGGRILAEKRVLLPKEYPP